MKVAITIWNTIISPVFDSASMLLIATMTAGEIINKAYEPFQPALPDQLAERLIAHNITVLFCGAISQFPARVIEGKGIRLIPFVTGNVQDLLETFASGNPVTPDFLMPGCRGRYGRCCRQTNRRQSLRSGKKNPVFPLPER